VKLVKLFIAQTIVLELVSAAMVLAFAHSIAEETIALAMLVHLIATITVLA
jgi:hypothetical protein